MSNTKYIEIDSTFRDRNRWPIPGQFEMLISQSGRKAKNDAVDPVSNATPILVWTSNRVNASVSGISVSGVVSSVAGSNNIASTNNFNTFTITSAAGNLQQVKNYYQSLVLVNTTINESRRILSYEYLGTDNGGTNDKARITVETGFSDAFSNGDSWTINDPTDISDTSNPLFFVPSSRLGSNSYAGCILYNETRDQFRTINGFDIHTHLLSVDATNPIITWLITDNYTIRKQVPVNSTTVAASTTTTVQLTSGSSEDNIYKNSFIRIRPTIYGNGVVSPEQETRVIVSYDGATMTATVSPPFSSAPLVAGNVEILGFSYDNMNPFVYTGSVVSQQEMVCYEIELLNLSLPNKTLQNSLGSRIAFYPFVYVELSNVSGASAGSKNTIYSNNPNSTRMVFRAAIDDVPNPTFSSFIKIDGDGMVQTLKFKPNDNLRFSVKLPDGSLYETVEQETFSPLPPNPAIQMSGIFSIKRL